MANGPLGGAGLSLGDAGLSVVSLSGGRGRILNTLIAAIFLSTITNGLIQLGASTDTQRIISGAILIVALSLDRLRAGAR